MKKRKHLCGDLDALPGRTGTVVTTIIVSTEVNRTDQIARLSDRDRVWDIIVVGGGATGLGIAVDAASRGLRTACLERTDFAKCTSSRSTKLVHGGVRYLQKGDIALVMESLRERGRMRANAPHLVGDQPFVVANYRRWDNFLYFCGLTLYDILSFGRSFGHSRLIPAGEVARCLPTAVRRGLRGGIVYHDGCFDDSRMAVDLALTAVDLGGTVVNHVEVTGVRHDRGGRVCGVECVDRLSGERFSLRSRCVVNAAGCFVDDVMRMDNPGAERTVVPSQGVHIVVDGKFLGGGFAMMVPRTSDGRVLFAVPWHGRTLLGTTDIPRPEAEEEPRPMKEEIDFILGTAGLYLDPAPGYGDILSVFAGQRPLAAPKARGKSTKEISRGHKVIVSDGGLVTVTGGKWTSYRLMAEDAVDRAIRVCSLPKRRCMTRDLRIHGWREDVDRSDPLYVYGADEKKILDLIGENPGLGKRISPAFSHTAAEVVWAVREDMAMSVEDVLARRLGMLFVDARASVEAAPEVARIMARELGLGRDWIDSQVSAFTAVARNYIFDGAAK